MINPRPSLHDRNQVVSAAQLPTTLSDLCSQPILFRGTDVQDQDFMITSSKIERDHSTGEILEATLHLLNLENLEGIDFMIAERQMGGYVALLPDTPVVIINSLPEFFDTIAETYRVDLGEEKQVGIRL